MEARKWNGSLIQINESYEGEAVERELEKLLDGENTLTSSGSSIYTKKADGVLPEYDIRTDRMEIAQDAMGKVNAARLDYRPWESEKSDDGE